MLDTEYFCDTLNPNYLEESKNKQLCICLMSIVCYNEYSTVINKCSTAAL